MPAPVAARFPGPACLALTRITIYSGQACGLLHGCNLPPHSRPQPVGNFAAVTHNSPWHIRDSARGLWLAAPFPATLSSDLRTIDQHAPTTCGNVAGAGIMPG